MVGALKKVLIVIVCLMLLVPAASVSGQEAEVRVAVKHYAKAEIVTSPSSNYLEVRANSSWLVQTDQGDVYTGKKTAAPGERIMLEEEIKSFTIIPR